MRNETQESRRDHRAADSVNIERQQLSVGTADTADTIAALATPRGAGGIAILRISGPSAASILRSIFIPRTPFSAFPSHRMMYGHAVSADGSVLDEVMSVLMPGPHSYTREDVAEIQCHGGEISARRILSRLLELGAVPAAPGEFTKRAFLNGRIDLSRAEAVMQLIGASSEAAARASVRQLEGGVSGFVRDVNARILAQLSLIEASTDFPDEVEEEAAAADVAAAIRDILAQIARRCDPRSARMLREGASIVLAGRPNVGKSSLMNALLNQERAIVTAIPGTTRDVLTERISIGGVLAELSDTAGQRSTLDPVEKIGVDRAKLAMDRADVVLIVIDASEPLSDEDADLLRTADDRAIVCLNKSDLPAKTDAAAIEKMTSAPVLELSASSGAGVQSLLKALEARLSENFSEDSLTVERHVKLAQKASEALGRALESLERSYPLDLTAMDLREALSTLSEITAENPTEALITEIFSNFCVGK